MDISYVIILNDEVEAQAEAELFEVVTSMGNVPCKKFIYWGLTASSADKGKLLSVGDVGERSSFMLLNLFNISDERRL